MTARTPKEVIDYDLEDDLKRKFPKVWARLTNNPTLLPQDKPFGFLLGGQPGAGKSFATLEIKRRLNDNVVVINGDEFRAYHKHYEDFYHLYGKEAAKYTAAFAGRMVERVRDEVIKHRFNVVIEGTFRTTETPLKELRNFNANGYAAEVIICTCPKAISWESTLKRAQALEEVGLQPRYVPQAHHDIVVENLAQNTKIIWESGLVTRLVVYSRAGKLFDSQTNAVDELEPIINAELNHLEYI